MGKRLNFNRLAHFIATVEAGTITGAAAALGISKAVVSKQLQLLEEDVGTPLLLRNTRHLQPTDAGRVFYEDAKSALTQANNAYERIQDRDKTPKGVLRITAPVDFGVSYVAPFVARFQDTYPEVTIDLHLTDGLVDIIEDRYDLAFRIGWLSDSSNLARKLLDFEVIAICSPSTERRLNVKNPDDLATAPFVRSTAFPENTEWVFEKNGRRQVLSTHTVSTMNITLAMRTYVAAGFCYTLLPDFLLKEDLKEGRLKQLLPDWSSRAGGVYTVTPPSRVRSNALQRFLDMAHKDIRK
ncbi:LysR family transcriptional regulator [uncultured Tateyamaria sp.]|uniref:LysR family transcriptional regulator n=1 Tax=uncultured Tateyamaria sp. TaxID=455651 RepID=UPI002634B5E2|nr:LysR family transcriptional regulator [uncultured Tateyamaria sp.]